MHARDCQLVTGSSGAVFLSYASQDAQAARHICEALRSAGIEVWFDQNELRGGDVWDRQIRSHIHDCALFIPIISRTTQGRLEGYFRREWKLAVDRTHDMADGKPFLLPVVIDDTKDQEAEVPETFRSVQWTWLPDGQTPAAFAERVARLLSPGRPRAPSQPSPSPASMPNEASRPEGPTSPSGRWRPAVLSIATIIALLAGGYAALHRFVPSLHVAQAELPAIVSAPPVAPSSSALPEKSIAVLPFVDMSEKRDQEYFSDGLSEELIDHLAHSADLKVTARTSSFQFKGKNEDIRTIAAKLGVANLLEGSVRTSGRSMRITAQLIRASDGTHLWSHSYDRQMSDIFKVQDEIAATVVAALKATLTGSPPDSAGREQNVAAHNLLLKGNFFYERNHPGDRDRAIEQYNQALKLDPKYALAWAKLARVYIVQGDDSKLSKSEQESRAYTALQRALAIDPNLAAAHRWLGRVYLNFRWDWTSAKNEFERAIALDPAGEEGMYAQSDLFIEKAFTSGRFEDAIRHESEQLEHDPLDAAELWVLGWSLFYGGRLEEAVAMQRRLLELDPAYSSAHGDAAKTWLALGKNAEALAETEKETDEESRLLNLALVLWSMNRRTDADLALRQLESKFADIAAYGVAEVHAYRGETNAAMAWLERAYRQRSAGIVFIKVDPWLRSLRSEPRYQALLRKLNLAD